MIDLPAPLGISQVEVWWAMVAPEYYCTRSVDCRAVELGLWLLIERW